VSPAARRGREDGSATVLVTPLLGVLTVVTVLLGVVGGALATLRRAESAADLAALAGAAAAVRGDDGCAAAARVAARNQVDLGSCVAVGTEVRVVVTTRTAPLLGRTFDVRARARAGPA
jgi:secretion/DNA translocation related TadE-like protein